MSTPGGNAASELGAQMPPNGRFRLKVRIGRAPICISGKCGCESSLSGEIKCSGKATAKTDISFEKGGAFGLASPAWCEDGGTAGKQALKKAGGDIGLFSFARRREIGGYGAPFDAFAQIPDGKAEIKIGGKPAAPGMGKSAIMPAGLPHPLGLRKISICRLPYPGRWAAFLKRQSAVPESRRLGGPFQSPRGRGFLRAGRPPTRHAYPPDARRAKAGSGKIQTVLTQAKNPPRRQRARARRHAGCETAYFFARSS